MRPVYYRLQALGRQQSFMRMRACRLSLSRWLRQLLTTFYRASGLVVVAAFSFGPSMAEARENAEEVSSSGRRGRSHQSEGLLDEVWTLPEDPCPDEDDLSGRCGRGPETVDETGAGPLPLTDLAPPAIAGVAALSALVMTRNGEGGSSPAAPAATAVPHLPRRRRPRHRQCHPRLRLEGQTCPFLRRHSRPWIRHGRWLHHHCARCRSPMHRPRRPVTCCRSRSRRRFGLPFHRQTSLRAPAPSPDWTCTASGFCSAVAFRTTPPS